MAHIIHMTPLSFVRLCVKFLHQLQRQAVQAHGMTLPPHHHVAQAGMTTVLQAQASLAQAGQIALAHLAQAGTVAQAIQVAHQAGIKYV